jgi:hypothetical protein
MESRPFDNLLAIGLLLDFWVEERKHALHWRAITRRIISFISYRPWLLRRQKICKDLGLSWAIIGPQRGCQTLASGTWGPRKLAELLEAMQHFHCTDVRDRLYGVLSLVDWQDTTIPVPDYEQDSFQIAVEIMRRYLGQRSCAPTSDVVTQWAQQLCGVFTISTEQESVREAIEARLNCAVMPRAICDAIKSLANTNYRQEAVVRQMQHLVPVVDALTQSPRSMGRRKTKSRNLWYGMCLRAPGIFELKPLQESTKYLCFKAPSKGESVGKILDQYGRVFAYSRKETEVGDWLLWARSTSVLDIPMALIARPSDANEFSIIGQAHIFGDCLKTLDPYLGFEHFEVVWHPEDIILFYLTYISRIWSEDSAMSEDSAKTLGDWLSLGICRSDGSSYARSIHIPRKSRQRSLKPRFASLQSSLMSTAEIASAKTPLTRQGSGRSYTTFDSDSD